MASPLTEVTNFDINVTVPDDGDTANVASAITAWQPLANRTQMMKLRTMPDVTAIGVPASTWFGVETIGVGTFNSALVTVPMTNILAGEQVLILGSFGVLSVGAGFHGFKLRDLNTAVDITGWYTELSGAVAAQEISVVAHHTYVAAAPSTSISLRVENASASITIGSPLNIQAYRLNPGV